MSSVRGGGFRGRGRGSSQPAPTRGRVSSSRGQVYSSNASRGSTVSRGTFGQPSRQDTNQPARGQNAPNVNGTSQPPTQRSAFGAAKTRGSWQERYQTLMKARERERAEAIRHGQIADPDKPRSLAEAVTPVGTCQDMCAEYERVQRVVQKDVWDEEMDPNHSAFATTEKEPDEARMVKKFRRAAAGLEEQLPSDLRPPHILKRTCDYLFDEVIGTAPSLAHVHHFVWDRTRAIRNDFSIQQVAKPDELRMAIDCYERIARFHILSLHQLALLEKPYSKYDWQQEREQLDRTLLSLMQYYDDSRGRIDLPNEAEFRAYCVIFQLQDPTPDLEDRVQTWPKAIVRDTRVQKAVDLYMAACNVMDAQGPLKPRANHLIARQDWQRFWTLVSSKEVSYLMACVAEIYFNLVRRTVLNALFRTFRMNSNLATPDWTVDTLCDLLAFDDGDEVYTYCERFGFSFQEREDGQQYLDLTSIRGRTLPEPSAGMPKQSKSSLVEHKRFGRTLPAVINGLAVKQAEDLGLVNEEEDGESMEDAMRGGSPGVGLMNVRENERSDAVDDEESLFIPESTRTGDSQEQTFPAFKTGAADEKPSIFSGGLSGSSTFGKPSNFGDQPSIFAQRQNQTTERTLSTPSGNGKPKFDFSNPAATGFSTPVTSAPFFDFTGRVDSNTAKQSDSSPKDFSFGQPSTDSSSVFVKAAPPTQSTPRFSFTPPTKPKSPELKIDAGPEISQLSKSPTLAIESSSPSPEQPKGQFVFDGQAAGVAAPPTPSSTSLQSETKPLSSQPQLTSSSTSPTSPSNNQSTSSSGFGLGGKRSSFSTDTKPKKPSPLSNSFTAGDDNSTVASESSERKVESRQSESFQTTSAAKQVEQPDQRSTAEEFNSLITRLSDDLFNDPDVGLLKQYIEYAVVRTIREVHDKFITERNNQEADDWRRFTLHQKYGRRWRDLFWQRRLAKTGRERRERRQRRLQQRESQQPDNSSLYEGASFGGSSRGGSVFETGFGDFENRKDPVDRESRKTFERDRWSRPSSGNQQKMASSKRPMSSRGEDAPMASRELGHKRLKSTRHVDERGRITKPISASHPNADILKRSSFLGFSVAKDGGANNKNTTMSNYFRHKALGLGKVDTLTGLRGTKRRSESLQISSETSPPALRSSLRPGWTPERTTNKALMPPPSSAPSRTAKANEDDEALFARLRAARESLKGGLPYFKSESVKDDVLQRSVSSQSSTDSPSMIKARTEARLRASLAAPTSDAKAPERSVPAYRLRESKFVPREHYGRAIERAQESRESRSRGTSRSQSRIDQHTPDQAAHPPQATQQVGQQGGSQVNESVFQAHALHGPNGFPQSSNAANQISPSQPTSKPFMFKPQAPVSFADHTTHLSSDNPFLQASTQTTADSLAMQNMFSFKTAQPAVNESQDRTIRPSQINQSLASSFGASSGFGQHTFQSVPQYSPTPPQQDSYMHSQAISLLSDDEDDAPATFGNPQQVHSNAETDEATEELLDNATDDEGYDMYAHVYPHAVQSHHADDDETESQGWDSQAEDQEGYGYVREPRDYDDDSGEDLNGYADDEDEGERAVDADMDEDETGDVDEDGEGYGYDDEEGGYDPHSQWRRQEDDNQWTAGPSKNPALQDVGNTAEEAIELSD